MKLLLYPSATSNLTNVNNIFARIKLGVGTPFTFIDDEPFVSIYENNIYRVLIEDPLNIFDINLIYYNKYESLYESLQDAITASNPLSIGENNTNDVTILFPFKTYTPYPAICSNNQDQIFIAPEKIDYEIEYCNTCTVILGDYTLVFKLQTHPFYDLESQYGPFYDLDYRLVSTTQPISNGMNQIDPLNVEYSNNNIILTFTSFDWNGTVTIDLDDFNLSGTMTGTGSYNYDQDLTNVTTAAFTFSNPIKPPEQIRVYLPDAFFSGNGNIQLGTIDEILTLDEELQCYISDELNIYNIPARIILPLTLNTINSNKPLIESGTILKLNNHITPTNNNSLGQNTHYCNIDGNNYNGSFTVPYNNVDDVRMYSIYKAKEINGYIAPRNIFLIDTHAHLIDTTQEIRMNVFYAYFKNPAKEYFTLSSGSETYPNYIINPETGLYKPWHPNINTFKHANFIIQADDAFISSIRIGAAPDAPTITFNDDAIEQDEETLIIQGTDFNLNYEDNLVTFNLGAFGTVTAATTTQLTVTFTTQPTSLGNLEVTLLMPLSSGTAVQVATVVAGIVVTPNSDSRAINAPTLVIAGTGFSATANQNTVTFNLGAVGTVTSATTTELTITFSTQPTTTGSLTAVVAVSTSNGDSGTAVEVATIVTYGSLVLIDTISIDNKGYSALKPSYDGLSLYGLDYINNSIDNYDRNLSTGIITLDDTISTVFDQPFEMFVTSDDLILVFSTYGPGYEIYTRANSNPIGSLSLVNSYEIDSYYITSAIVISNNENNFYWAGSSLNNTVNIWNFKIDANDNDAFLESNVETDYPPQLLAISPDGKNVYSESYFNFGYLIEIFDRENQDGDLTKNDDNEINIIYPVKVVVSPDNLFVYVFLDNNTNNPPIKIFARNTTTGSLTLDDTIYPNIGSFKDAIISIDGKNCYVRTQVATPPSTIDYYLVLGEIDNQTGALTFSTQYEVSYGDFNTTIESFDEQFVYAASGYDLFTYSRIT
jgi:hypothetical protein